MEEDDVPMDFFFLVAFFCRCVSTFKASTVAGAPVGTWWQTAGPIFPIYTYEEGCCAGGICKVITDAILHHFAMLYFHSEGSS